MLKVVIYTQIVCQKIQHGHALVMLVCFPPKILRTSQGIKVKVPIHTRFCDVI